VTVDNIQEIAECGVDMFVAGSAILKAPREEAAYKKTVRAQTFPKQVLERLREHGEKTASGLVYSSAWCTVIVVGRLVGAS
jgi:hypothetical protein